MAYVNLALLYLTQCKHGEYYEIAEKLKFKKFLLKIGDFKVDIE